jgi:hypothetical protein
MYQLQVNSTDVWRRTHILIATCASSAKHSKKISLHIGLIPGVVNCLKDFPIMSTSTAITRFSRPRFAILVLIGVYPVITVILNVIFPLTVGWTIWQRTLLIAPLMVGIMIWGVIPVVQKQFRSFINPAIGEGQ